MRIFTGGVIPDGADAVIIQEDTAADGDHITITEAADKRPAHPPRRRRFPRRRRAARPGKPPHRRAICRWPPAMNYPELAVRRRPKVAVLATGDELVMPGATPGPGQIVYSNGYALGRWRAAEGAETIDLGIAADTIAATTDGIRRARDAGADILVTMRRRLGRRPRPRQALAGGRGRRHGVLADRDAAGQADDARTARRDAGDRPARQSRVVLCLRLPVSGAADSRAVGPRRRPSRRETALLGRDLAANDQREDYLRARLEARDDGALIATPGRPPGLLAAWKSRCGTGDYDTSAICAGSQRGQRSVRDLAPAGMRPVSRVSAQPLHRVHLKLSGCGTHIEHIVSVHDLFRAC